MTGFVSSDPLNNLTNLYNRPVFIPADRLPTTNDLENPGTEWQNGTLGSIYKTSGQGNWFLLGSSASNVNTLTGDNAVAISPSSNNINLLGTTNQIVTTGSGSTITWTLAPVLVAPGSIASTSTLTAGTNLAVTNNATVGGTLGVTGVATFTGGVSLANLALSGTLGVTGLSTLGALTQVGTSNINASGAAVSTIGTGGTGAVHIGNATGNTAVTGSLTTSTTLTASAGAITATNGNLVLGSTGNKLVIHATTAASDSVGTATLVAGTVTVACTAVTASSLIYVSCNTPSGTEGILSAPIASISAGVHFVINSSNASDTSTVNYLIVN